MERIYESGASATPPTPPAAPSAGYPSAGNPGTGTMPTVPGPFMFHQIVEEIMAVILAANLTPNRNMLNQMKQALDASYAALGGLPTQLFQVAAASAAAHALRLDQIAGSSGTPSWISIPYWDGATKRNLIVQWGLVATTVAAASVTFPIAFPTGCLALLATNAQDNSFWPHAFNQTRFGFSIRSDTTPAQAFWLAIGN